MTKKHQKHTKLVKPQLGHFGRNEWAIIGTPCGNIQELARQLSNQLGKGRKVSYIDADHGSGEADLKSVLEHQGVFEYTDKIHFHRIDFKAQLDTYQFKTLFNEQDLILVNGNHFKAARQIVVIDPKKEESLSRKLDRLTDVQLLLFVQEERKVPAYLKDHLPNIDDIPAFQLQDIHGIAEFLEQQLQQAIPPIGGLVLAGGYSQRMGRDKGLIDYHGQPQRSYMYQMLGEMCNSVHLSCRPDQGQELKEQFEVIEDTFTDLGPFGGILSAFRQNPNQAWLVIACDLPLLDHSTIQQLLDARDPSKIATAFHSPVNEFPEPLIAIWEPKSYPILLQFLAQGYSCARKALINSDVHLIHAESPESLQNINTPEEYESLLAQLSKTKV
jgi:molybdopterin-guanine dinucleotide biosynthesis protein A